MLASHSLESTMKNLLSKCTGITVWVCKRFDCVIRAVNNLKTARHMIVNQSENGHGWDWNYGTPPAGVERTDEEVRHEAPLRLLAELRDQGEGRARRIRASLTLNNIYLLISTCAVSFSDSVLCALQIMLIQNYSDECWCRRNTLGW